MMKKDSTSKENVFKDVVRVVVREEIQPFEKRLNKKIDGLDGRMDNLEDRMDGLGRRMTRLENDFSDFADKMEAAFTKFRSDIFNLLDPLMGEIKKYRENQSADAFAHRRFDEEIEALKKAVHLA